jgi:hypothetical protein
MFTEMQQMRTAGGKFSEKMTPQTNPQLAMAEFIKKQRMQMLSPYIANPHQLPNRKELSL